MSARTNHTGTKQNPARTQQAAIIIVHVRNRRLCQEIPFNFILGNPFFFLQKDVNECNTSPCHNGGTCVNHVGGYSCRCPGGYEGKDCGQGNKGISQENVFRYMKNTVALALRITDI